jgi:hypothetical protein
MYTFRSRFELKILFVCWEELELYSENNNLAKPDFLVVSGSC